jgi:tRNA(Ile2) C34 agmatinyltransferase TiaS
MNAGTQELLDALKLAAHMLEGHPTRSVGKCEECGGNTSSGTLRVCRKCGMQIITAAIATAEGGKVA